MRSIERRSFYRADKRDFEIGSTIYSAGEFSAKNPIGSVGIESLFEELRPAGKPQRVGCLFVFEDLLAAKKHWSKMTGGKLYEVRVEPCGILHRADMSLLEAAFASGTDIDKIRTYADLYWSGMCSEHPTVEILVKHAIVLNVISKDECERKEFLKSWALQ